MLSQGGGTIAWSPAKTKPTGRGATGHALAAEVRSLRGFICPPPGGSGRPFLGPASRFPHRVFDALTIILQHFPVFDVRHMDGGQCHTDDSGKRLGHGHAVPALGPPGAGIAEACRDNWQAGPGSNVDDAALHALT